MVLQSVYFMVKFWIFIPEFWDFIHQIVGDFSYMSRCKLRIPWPIHFKLSTAIGIDSFTVCMLFGEISIFHSRVMGKKVFTYKYCMNVDDGRVMRSWHSCLFKKVVNWIGKFFFISTCKKMGEKTLKWDKRKQAIFFLLMNVQFCLHL